MRIEELKTPCYVIDEKQLKKNLSILQKVEKDTGCKILLAQKAFSCFYEYPLIGQYLSGTTASGLFEARLGKEEMGKENHVFAPAYKEEDVKELVKICDHMVFNSFSQLEKYKNLCQVIQNIDPRVFKVESMGEKSEEERRKPFLSNRVVCR